jgi:pimeloyl-ACP methyl ester carboxylesterase
MKRSPYYPFRSQKAKERYLRRYDVRAQAWPVASESRTMETSFGQTLVRISGPPEAPPLVLLPSAAASSLIWMTNVKALSQHYRVYAVDSIYDFGRSVCSRDIKSIDDLMSWLDGLFDALKLGSNVNLMGLSYGAWLTNQYALRFPNRLSKIVMCAPPATLFPFPVGWAWRGLTAMIPHRHFLMNMTRWMFPDLTQKTDEVSRTLVSNLTEDAFIGMRCFKFRMPIAPTVLTDEELQSIKVPALFLVGEHEVLYPAQKAIQRLKDVAPSIKAEIIPNAGHDLTIVQAELVNEKVLEFLKQWR